MGDSNYKRFMDSTLWGVIRAMKIHLAGNKCERCGEPGGPRGMGMHVHHLDYARFGGWEREEDLQCLCKPCHDLEHRSKHRDNYACFE